MVERSIEIADSFYLFFIRAMSLQTRYGTRIDHHPPISRHVYLSHTILANISIVPDTVLNASLTIVEIQMCKNGG